MSLSQERNNYSVIKKQRGEEESRAERNFTRSLLEQAQGSVIKAT